MENAKKTGTWLACIAGSAIALAIATLLQTKRLIQQVSLQCATQNLDICGEFVPWVWICISFSAIAALASVLWFARRRPLAGRLAPISFFILLLVTAYSMWLWFRPSDYALAKPNANHEARRIEDLARQIDHAKAGAELEPQQPRGHHPFPDLPQSRDGLPLNDDPFIATSKAEQAWLDRNGYPNAQQWAAYTRASDVQLRDAAKQGDKGATALLGHRRLMAGDDTAVVDLLTEGAKGSGFALDMLASYLASVRGGNRQTAYAISRVSEMRGNFRVAAARDLMFDTPLTNTERMQGDQEAMEIYNSLLELQRKIRGPGSSPVDPRPIGG
ncbi:hypothetical protein MUU77_03410 [Pseudoxanthomonas sp. F37]|uniref:hypothetical protein n=1 Tax=Pseudoxanthomonas TaxID=83618 RepID=UPI001FD5726B|nr:MULTISPECIES: hypothetical protein [Pseudoxanthomonas]UOV04368.1 hypothetical protein MUU75_14715 [Pseudoxanthomonas mexicana]UOV09367.1 hypothetical protein MUU77_03410 [Pseudoxanthomonas sp. F37]